MSVGKGMVVQFGLVEYLGFLEYQVKVKLNQEDEKSSIRYSQFLIPISKTRVGYLNFELKQIRLLRVNRGRKVLK